MTLDGVPEWARMRGGAHVTDVPSLPAHLTRAKPPPANPGSATKSKGSCAGKGRKNLKGEGAGRPGVTCPSQGYKK